MHGLRLTSALAVVLCALAAVNQAAARQPWFAGPLVRSDREISAREFGVIQQVLGLEGGERDAAGVLFEAYRDSLASGALELRAKIKPLFGKDAKVSPEERTTKLQAMIAESRAARKDARARFIDDLKTVLTTEQEDRWRRVERYERRQAGIKTTDVCGANIDMVELVIELKTPPEVRGAIDGDLIRYELEFEAVLADRERRLKSDPRKGPVSLGPQEFHAKMDELRALGVQMRDVNKACLRRIEATAPADIAEQFQAEFKKRAFAAVYKRPDQTAFLNRVRAMKDLSSEQQSAVLEAGAMYEKNLRENIERWIAAQEEAETKGLVAPRIQLGTQKFEELPALLQARAARTEMDKACRDKVMAILTQEQRDRVSADAGEKLRETLTTGSAVQLPTGEFIGADAETGEMVEWGGEKR